jgi:hypothetical protein
MYTRFKSQKSGLKLGMNSIAKTASVTSSTASCTSSSSRLTLSSSNQTGPSSHLNIQTISSNASSINFTSSSSNSSGSLSPTASYQNINSPTTTPTTIAVVDSAKIVTDTGFIGLDNNVCTNLIPLEM